MVIMPETVSLEWTVPRYVYIHISTMYYAWMLERIKAMRNQFRNQ